MAVCSHEFEHEQPVIFDAGRRSEEFEGKPLSTSLTHQHETEASMSSLFSVLDVQSHCPGMKNGVVLLFAKGW